MDTVKWICERVARLNKNGSPRARRELRELLARSRWEIRDIDRRLETYGIRIGKP